MVKCLNIGKPIYRSISSDDLIWVCVHHRIACSLWSLGCWDSGSWISWTSTARRWCAPPRTSFDRYGTRPTHETEIRAEVTVSLFPAVCCEVRAQISEIDADAVKWVMKVCIQCEHDRSVYHKLTVVWCVVCVCGVCVCVCVVWLCVCVCDTQVSWADALDDVSSVVRSAAGYFWTLHPVPQEDQGNVTYRRFQQHKQTLPRVFAALT